MTRFSENVRSLQPSATIAVSSRVKQLIAEGRDILDLCVGEPDFPTPAFISDAGIQAIRDGKTKYTPAPGIPELRAAIADELGRVSGRGSDIDAHGVVVSAGAKQALFNICFSLFGPGDRVLIPVPYWTSYPAIVELARAEAVSVAPSRAGAVKITPSDLEQAAADGAAGLILNSPSNPTGAVYSLEELEAIAVWAAANGVWIISDEIYRRINFNGPLAPGVLDLDPGLTRRTVIIDGASKAFSMTGWRIGFSYSSREIAEKASALQSQTTSSATTPAQYAALAAYRADEAQDAEIEAMRVEFKRRSELLTGLFREQLPAIEFIQPEGAFYLWLRTAPLAREGEGSIAFCERLLDEAGVALVPGAAFGDDDHARLSFAYPEETLREAVRRLATLG
jgi:aspartate aminotransferase